MNTLLRTTAVLVSCLLIGVASASDDPGDEYSIQLFMNACVSTYGHANAVNRAAKERGLSEVKGDQAAPYLKGQKEGRVWYGSNQHGTFALSLLPNRLCTVFIHTGNGDRIRAGLESWLPPSGVGVDVKKENIPSPPGVTSTAYTMRGGKVREQWVLSVVSATDAPLRAIISYANQ